MWCCIYATLGTPQRIDVAYEQHWECDISTSSVSNLFTRLVCCRPVKNFAINRVYIVTLITVSKK